MHKYVGLLIVILLLLNSGFIITLSAGLGENSENEKNTNTISNFYQPSYDLYPAENVYFLTSYSTFSTLKDLRGVPSITDGSDPNLNKCAMVNGRTYSFVYPYHNERSTKLVYNPEFSGEPFISLVINTLDDPGKTFVASLGIDTNDNYDPRKPETLEHRCSFGTYETTIDRFISPLEEEYYNAFGTWDGNDPPKVITKARLVLEVTMTSPNGEPAILYCGFNFKSSWLAIPYMHNDLDPKAKINESSCNQGIPPKDSLFTGDRVYFDGSDSYDANDDFNGNERIDGFEIDRLKYRWSWGDGTTTNLAYRNKFAFHTYSSDDLPLTWEYRDFLVNLSVLDQQGYSDFDTTIVRIYRGNHSPEIESVHINKVQVCPTPVREVVSVLSDKVKVYFSAQAVDPDYDELTYMWDFDGNLTDFEIMGDSDTGAEVFYIFDEPDYQQGRYELTLVVSDGTLANDAKAKFYIYLRHNTDPVARIFASREGDDTSYIDEISIKLKQKITFYGDSSYDPDGLVGFDTNNDSHIDKQLRYRWNFNSYNPQESTDWSYNSIHQYSYDHPGRFKYWVTLDVDDGINVTTSKPFKVIINTKPVAKIIIDPRSYDTQGNLNPYYPVIFNGSLSHDPNEDAITDYVWGFYYNDEMKRIYNSSMEVTYEDPGFYSISLQVFDGELWSYPDTLQFEITKPPRGSCSNYRVYPLDVYTFEPVFCKVNLSSEPGFIRDNLVYTWYFGDGVEQTTSANHTTYKYSSPGTYRISLKMTDFYNQNETYSNILVTVKNRAPEAKITPISDHRVDWSVRLSGQESKDIDGNITKYLWSFGDGSDVLETTDPFVEHTWDEDGVYTVHLTVEDDLGSSSNDYMVFVFEDTSTNKVDLKFITGISVIILFNIIAVPLLIRQITLLRARKNKKKRRLG
jgi:hypothetical protein